MLQCCSKFAMSTHMRKNPHPLKLLYQAKPKLCKAMLKHVEHTCIKVICECVQNVFRNVVKT